MIRHRLFTLVALGIGASATSALVLAQDKPSAAPGKPNAQMQAVLDELAALGPKPLETLTPAEARKQPGIGDAVKVLLKKQNKSLESEKVAAVKDIGIPDKASNIPARIYTPAGSGPFPVLVYWHGGGWVLADLNTYDASCRALCNAAECIVVSCDYRHAPEHPFPAAAEDAFTAYRWVIANAKTINGDVNRIAVAGESAGGNLAAGVALRARDEKHQAPIHQLLIYPVTNNDMETESYKFYAEAKPLKRPMMKWFFGHYFSAERGIAGNANAFPQRSANHTGLPSATIITAEVDPLRDDGKIYAATLEKADVKVIYRNFDGVTHEFFGLGAVVDTSKDAMKLAADNLITAFGGMQKPRP